MNEHGNSVVFDTTSIMIDAVSADEHSWTIVSDEPFRASIDGIAHITTTYGEQFIYHKANFLAPFGAQVSIQVQCADGQELRVEMRKGTKTES